MATICIGPLCIPVEAAIPFLFILLRMALRWFTSNVLGIKSPEETAAANLPPAPAPVPTRTWHEGVVHVRDVAHLKELAAKARESAGGRVVLDFTATWCGPCRMIAPVFEALSKEYNACFAKVDVDQADDVAHAFSVRSMPTFVVLDASAPASAAAGGQGGGDDNKGGGYKELVRFSGCNKARLQDTVAATCARIGAAATNTKKEE